VQIAIFTTGGTIDKVYFDREGNYHVGPPMVHELLVHARLCDIPRITELLRKDSLEMSDADRETIRAAIVACEAPRILITHGTDTMVQTAAALSGIPDKTIVLTGALQPGRFADSDAAFNLGLAYGAVQLCSPGVYLVAHGAVFPADRVRQSLELDRFELL
jgi:L-asparaginase